MVDYKVVAWGDRELFETRVTPSQIVAMARQDFIARSTPNGSSVVLGNSDGDDEHMIQQSYPPIDPSELRETDVLVSLAPMHYGMQDQNPLLCVKFYSKSKPNGKSTLSADCSGTHTDYTSGPQCQAWRLFHTHARKIR